MSKHGNIGPICTSQRAMEECESLVTWSFIESLHKQGNWSFSGDLETTLSIYVKILNILYIYIYIYIYIIYIYIYIYICVCVCMCVCIY